MTAFFVFLGWIAAVAALIPSAVLIAEALASFLPPRQRGKTENAPSSVVIVIPAHNEGANMQPTLQDVFAALAPGMRVLVVADNCEDDTAEIAAAAGAEAIERRDPEKRGKGFALQYAVDHLRADPPDYVVFLDADSRFDAQALTILAKLCQFADRPIQALYLMNAPAAADARSNVARFAWALLNNVRMRGLSRLANVTRFTGVGLIAPWGDVSALDFGGGAITEDHELTFRLARQRRAPLLTTEVAIYSALPGGGDARVTQRARWEHGSLRVLAGFAAPGVVRALAKGNGQWLAISMDAMVPPLFIMGALLTIVAALTGVLAAATSAIGPLALSVLSLCLFAVAIIIAWLGYGRKIVGPRDAIGLIYFLLDKAMIYGRKGRDSTRVWTRTDRSGRE